MKAKSIVSQLLAAASVAALVLASAPASAGVKGQIILDLSNGCLATTSTACGPLPQNGLGQNSLAYVTGDFHFTDTLQTIYGAGLATQPFSYHSLITVAIGSTPQSLSPILTSQTSWANYAAFVAEPAIQFGDSLLQMMIGQGTAGTLAVDANHEITYALTGLSATLTESMGSFELWSFDDFNDVSQTIFNANLPAQTYFSLNLTISAIPEPASIALVGAGLLALALWRRRRRV